MDVIKHSNVKITLTRSAAGLNSNHKKIVKSLGLSYVGSGVILPNINSIVGQINKIIQFVKVEFI